MARQSFTATSTPSLVIGGATGGMGSRTVAFQVSGTFDATITFESTVDGTNYVAIGAYPISGSGTAATTATAAGIYRIPAAGLAAVRARCTAFTSGTVDVVAETCEGIF